MNTERPAVAWNLDLALTKKNGGFELEEELEMREGTGLMKGGASPDREFGGGIETGAVLPDHSDSVAKCPLSAIAFAL